MICSKTILPMLNYGDLERDRAQPGGARERRRVRLEKSEIGLKKQHNQSLIGRSLLARRSVVITEYPLISAIMPEKMSM